MLLRTLGFLLLLDGRNDAPRSTSCANNILVCDREEVAFIDGKFTTKLDERQCCESESCSMPRQYIRWQLPIAGVNISYSQLRDQLRTDLHVCDHF